MFGFSSICRHIDGAAGHGGHRWATLGGAATRRGFRWVAVLTVAAAVLAVALIWSSRRVETGTAPATVVKPEERSPPPAERELVRSDEVVTFRFVGDYPFELLEGSQLLQSAATVHELRITEPRPIRIRAVNVYLDQTVTLDPANSRRDVSVPRTATLIIRSKAYEDCLVSIADRPPEAFPLIVPVIVEGPQDVHLSCPDGRTLQRRIHVVRGQAVAINE